MCDEEIIALLTEHSEDGLCALKDKYNGLLKSVSNSILSNDADADECVNDTYLKLWNIIPPYRPAHLSSFVCRIVRQISIDRYRSIHSKKYDTAAVLSFDELGEDFPDECISDVDDSLRDAVNTFLKQTDVESRVLFIRRYFLIESVDDLSERFGIPKGNVNVKLFRTRQKLKKYLIGKGYYYESR